MIYIVDSYLWSTSPSPTVSQRASHMRVWPAFHCEAKIKSNAITRSSFHRLPQRHTDVRNKRCTLENFFVSHDMPQPALPLRTRPLRRRPSSVTSCGRESNGWLVGPKLRRARALFRDPRQLRELRRLCWLRICGMETRRASPLCSAEVRVPWMWFLRVILCGDALNRNP